MRSIVFVCRIALLPMLFLALLSPARAESSNTSTEKAPPLQSCQAAKNTDLGVWDDVFACHDQDTLVLRRGEVLFTSLMTTPSRKLKKLTTSSTLRRTRILACAGSGDRFWLFLQSGETAPFAIDLRSGNVSEFNIQGLKVPGSHAPEIQSHVIVRHADSALLMIAGGDRETWPRDGNRPIYCWMSLKSGTVVTFPIGWDLQYFSPNQEIAVFEKPQERDFERHPLQAVDVRTGRLMAETPDRRNGGGVPFDWTETQSVKPLYLRRAETGDRDHFAGISVNGSVFPADIGSNEVLYMSTAKANDGFVGFRLRREGAASGEPSYLWLMSLKEKQSPQLVANGVTEFAMLDAGNCVFVTAGHGRKGVSSEAWFRGAREEATWNVLDGVERLKELDSEFVDKDYVEDKLTVRLIDGFGHHSSLALCVFSHSRGDMRALAFPPPPQGKSVERITWRRVVILTSDGKRCLTDLFREGNLPDLIWLHNSGKVIMGTYLWRSSGSTRERKVQLSETTLRLQQKQE